MRTILVPLLLFALAITGGAAIASSLNSPADPPARSDGEPPADHPARTGSDSIDAEAPAARGGGSLGVAVYRDVDGKLCSTFGKVIDGKLGSRRNGRFEPLPLADTGLCAADRPSAKQPATVHVAIAGDTPDTPELDPQTVVWGIAGDSVTRVEITVGGAVSAVEPGARGAFLASFVGTPKGQPTKVTQRFSDGTSREQIMPAGRSQKEILELAEANEGSTHTDPHHP